MRLFVPVLLLLFGLIFFASQSIGIAHGTVEMSDKLIYVSGWQPAKQENVTIPLATTLFLNASKTEVFIEEDLTIYGFLRVSNESAVAGRPITITFGQNLTVVRTNHDGKFEALVAFPVGSPAGPTDIEVVYDPEASDSGSYLSSSSSLLVPLLYCPSSIEAQTYPENARPLDIIGVSGRLSNPKNMSMEYRTIIIRFDDAFVSNTSKNTEGQFYFRFVIPENISSGTHLVTITFPAFGDRFLPANVTLPLTIGVLSTSLNLGLDRTSALSGTKITIHGTALLANGTQWKYGHTRVYFDGSLYATGTVNAAGSFTSTIQLPIGVNFGWHLLKVEYNPDDPSIGGSEGTVPVYVLNTPLIAIASGAVIAVLSLALYRVAKKRHAVVVPAPILAQPAVEEPSPETYSPKKEEYSPEGLTSMIDGEGDHAAKVRRSYRLAQAMLAQKLDEKPMESQTHWEYFSRVMKKAPKLEDSFRRLSELFEWAEYSQTPVGRAQSEEATKLLPQLREEIWGEYRQEYGNDY